MTQIKLEVGKKYRNRKGEVHGPLKQGHSDKTYLSGNEWWFLDGSYTFYGESLDDLIEEVIEPQEPAKKPHKHAELIKAWADGADIQCWNYCDKEWVDIVPTNWFFDAQYRIKPEPEPKPDVVRFYSFGSYFEVRKADPAFDGVELKLTFDGETGELKSAEVLK